MGALSLVAIRPRPLDQANWPRTMARQIFGSHVWILAETSYGTRVLEGASAISGPLPWSLLPTAVIGLAVLHSHSRGSEKLALIMEPAMAGWCGSIPKAGSLGITLSVERMLMCYLHCN